jgi:hypothetical protein
MALKLGWYTLVSHERNTHNKKVESNFRDNLNIHCKGLTPLK